MRRVAAQGLAELARGARAPAGAAAAGGGRGLETSATRRPAGWGGWRTRRRATSCSRWRATWRPWWRPRRGRAGAGAGRGRSGSRREPRRPAPTEAPDGSDPGAVRADLRRHPAGDPGVAARPRLRELHLDSRPRLLPVPRFHPQRDSRVRPPAGDGHQQRDLLLPRDPPVRDAGGPRDPGAPRGGRRGRPLRLLSAGCSSGEEPYSLAIALQNAGLTRPGGSWEIDACDLNPERIARAQGGGVRRGLAPRLRRRRAAALLHARRAPASGCKDRYRAACASSRRTCWRRGLAVGRAAVRRDPLPQPADLLQRRGLRAGSSGCSPAALAARRLSVPGPLRVALDRATELRAGVVGGAVVYREPAAA